MRSRWNRVSLKSNITAKIQRMPKTAINHQKLGESKAGFFTRNSGAQGPADILISDC